MKAFSYSMPTKLFFGENCIHENKEVLLDMGKKALIMTGKHSAKKNGSLKDVISALTELGIAYTIFDDVEENPSIENIASAAAEGRKEKVTFIIGIGGGSPMDAAKAAACLLANPDKGTELFFGEPVSHLPVVEIPTTAGTGSETTPYAVLTVHEKKTKSSITQKVFAEVAFLDARYMETLPAAVTNNTAIDALSHLIEGYLNSKSNFLSDKIAQSGFSIFKECMPAIKAQSYSKEIREKLLLASTLGGFVISQTGTSLPHAMGYSFTYYKGIAHGKANGMLLKEYLALFQNQSKVNLILNSLGFSTLNAFGQWLDTCLDITEVFSKEEIGSYTKEVSNNSLKLKSHPEPIGEKEIYTMYAKSVLK